MGKKKKSNIGPLRTVLQVTLANDHPVVWPHQTLFTYGYNTKADNITSEQPEYGDIQYYGKLS